MYEKFGISKDLEDLANAVEEEIKPIFNKIDKIKEENSLKVLMAFQKNNLSDMHFGGTTGYGYGDIGRDTIEKIFAEVLGAEDSLVRNQFISGTHALTVALFSMLRPGDTMLSINGKPYDTLDEVIGIVENKSSLKSYGVKYEQIDLIGDDFDTEKIIERVKQGNVKLICMQRSRGYALRKSLSLESIKNIIQEIRKVNKEAIIMVDNCYGEFVDTQEPTSLGADLMVGSLIKNLGGGIAPNGAYIAGKKELVELAAERLTVPGQGKEVGPSLGVNRQLIQGLFFAPQTVSNAVKTAVFASKMLEKLGFEVSPKYDEKRTDIVQLINFKDEKKLIKFCQGIQMGSPVDSNSVPEPWDMPGYTDKVIMAAGTFIQGSSIELSCDAPIRPPYTAFLQGGLTYEYGKIGVLKAISEIEN
jgi:cystathionine beta-lyase family protein involved in aluminum resistance